MSGNKIYNKRCCIRIRSGGLTSLLATVILFLHTTANVATTSCSFNGNGSCFVKTNHDENQDLLFGNNSSVTWKTRPQNIGFMYYLRTTDDGNDLSVKGIVKWKVQLKNWTPNDTAVEGFLVTIMEHDTNETVKSYELTLSEPFEKFVENNDVLEMRMELDDVLGFEKRYDAKINILPIGKQAPASSFLSIMGKLEGEKCSAMRGLAERWAPHVMVDVYKTTSEIELSWQPAPSYLCIKTYEITLQNRDGVILNTSEIEVTPGQSLVNATFGNIEKNQMFQVKVRGKNSTDDSCACVNCNCITDKTKYFMIPEQLRPEIEVTITPPKIFLTPKLPTWTKILSTVGMIMMLLLVCLGCFCCRKYSRTTWKQKIAFSALKSTEPYPNRKTRAKRFYKVLLVCPEIEGRDYDYMMRIALALKNSNNNVVYDRWSEGGQNAEENVLRWVYEQTQKAEKIIIFHSTQYKTGCGVYDIITNFFPCNDPRLAHIALSPESQRAVPSEVEYVLPRDQSLLEEAYDISIATPLVVDIPREIVVLEPRFSEIICDTTTVDEDSPQNTKSHSTDSGVSSMLSNSSHEVISDSMQSQLDFRLKELKIDSHPLLRKAIPV